MREGLERELPVITAHSALSHASEIQLRVNHMQHAVVHRDASRIGGEHDILDLSSLLREHIQRQRLFALIHEFDSVLVGIHSVHREDRREQLLRHERTLGVLHLEHRGRDEAVLRLERRASADDHAVDRARRVVVHLADRLEMPRIHDVSDLFLRIAEATRDSSSPFCTTIPSLRACTPHRTLLPRPSRSERSPETRTAALR